MKAMGRPRQYHSHRPATSTERVQRYHQRQKEEMQRLREQVLEMETRLACVLKPQEDSHDD